MKRLLITVAAALLAAASQIGLAQTVLPQGSEISFVTRQMGVPVEGRFTRWQADIRFDPRAPSDGRVGFVIDTASARFGAAETDAEVVKADWLNVARFPQARFESGSIRSAGDRRYEVTGQLSIKGRSRQVVVPVTLDGKLASGSFTISRLAFDVGGGEWADPSLVADEVEVRFKLQMAATAPEAPPMTTTTFLLAMTAALAAPLAAAAPALYTIDPTHTSVMFEVLHRGTSTNRGRFVGASGSVTLDRDDRSGQVDLTLDMDTISTGVPAFDRHLRSADFFDVERHPTARFVGDLVVFDGDAVAEIQGRLTLRGRTHPVTLKALRFNCYRHPMLGREVCGGDFQTTILRSRWGVDWGLGRGAADATPLIVQVEAIRQ